MYGLEAVAAANGWAMALTGALIVLSGLTVLSIVISQLHKLVAVIKKEKIESFESTPITEQVVESKEPATPIDDGELLSIEGATSAYESLTDQLEAPFELKALYALGQANDYPHVHMTINSLRDAGRLIPRGGGFFDWDSKGTPPGDQPQPASPEPVVIEPAPPKPVVSEPIPPPAAPAPQPSRDVAGDEKVITSPMPGMIVRYEKKVGDTVNLGETVVILEAMKMENALASTGDGVIESIAFSSGDAVAKGDILCVIG